MTPENKELLLKDLCARLPYGGCFLTYKVAYGGTDVTLFDKEKMMGIVEDTLISQSGSFSLKKVRPYLRSISSMTEEEVDCLFKILNINEDLATEWLKVNDIGIIRLFTQQGKDFYEIAEAMDYLNSIHIDYRGLIEKGLAIEAPEGMYKIE